MNAAVDALGNLSTTGSGKRYLSDYGAVETAINVICKHSEYDVLIQK